VGVGGAVMIKPNHATHLPPRPQATPGPRAVRRARRGRAAKAERSEAAEGGLRVGVGGAVVVKPTRRKTPSVSVTLKLTVTGRQG